MTTRTVRARVSTVFVTLYRQRALRAVIEPALVVLPPLWLIVHFGERFWVGLVAVLYAFVAMAVIRRIARYLDDRQFTVAWLVGINRVLDNIVGLKERRFSQYAHELTGLTRESAFCEIARPNVQIAELVRGLCEFFYLQHGVDRRTLIRVFLAEIQDGRVGTIAVQYPQDVQIRDATILNDPRSTVMRAINSRSMILIQSIEKELKEQPNQSRYFADKSVAGQRGSLITYPIHYGPRGDIPLVLCVYSDRENDFEESREEVYRSTLDRFALWIRLEYSLLLMKEALCEPQAKKAA